MSHRIVIWGASGHALVVADVVRTSGTFEIAGFLEDGDSTQHGRPFGDARVLGGRERLAELHRGGIEALAVGIGDCRARLELMALARAAGFRLPTLVHPRAVVAASASLGAGTVVCAGAVVGAAAVLGEGVIVNTSATVDHECAVADGAHIGPGAHLGGGVRVDRAAWVGIGAVVSDHLCVGAGTIVGAGAVVVRDLPAHVVAYGVPARAMRPVER